MIFLNRAHCLRRANNAGYKYIENIDILITGDKDFLDVDIEVPKIFTPVDFVEKYVNK